MYTYMYFSQPLHTYLQRNTFTLYHLAWELKKPFITSFIMLHFIQPKINELLYSRRCPVTLFLERETSSNTLQLTTTALNQPSTSITSSIWISASQIKTSNAPSYAKLAK